VSYLVASPPLWLLSSWARSNKRDFLKNKKIWSLPESRQSKSFYFNLLRASLSVWLTLARSTD